MFIQNIRSNPEFVQLKDGRYVVYVIKAYYITDKLNGVWKKNEFDFDTRDRKFRKVLLNVSFAQREDGSYLAVNSGGEIWASKTGISPYLQISNKSVYPPYKGRYEDPVIWRTNIQYHMIVNDWYGRIAYYLRSKNGIEWKIEPGEAYIPGLIKYEDGTVEDWYKYERLKVLQDKYGRAIQANFAVIDTLKKQDKANDNHSSKNICIPLEKGKLITITGHKRITPKTKEILVKIQAEEGFNPHTDINVESLRFGASEEVNFGRGCKVMKTEKQGKDLILYFKGNGNGISERNFTAKLLGKKKNGDLLFAYARLPWLNYIEPVLSARKPVFSADGDKKYIEFEVQNFGQLPSKKTSCIVQFVQENKQSVSIKGKIPVLKPYEKRIIRLKNELRLNTLHDYTITIKAVKVQTLPLYEGFKAKKKK